MHQNESYVNLTLVERRFGDIWKRFFAGLSHPFGVEALYCGSNFYSDAIPSGLARDDNCKPEGVVEQPWEKLSAFDK
jgi:hypothetical protein